MLIRKDKQGNWGVSGLPWEELSIGQTITDKIWEKLYGCLFRLMQYEDTGMEPEQVYDLAKQNTKYCVPKYLGENTAIGCRDGECKCGNIVRSYQKFCDECGTKLEWGMSEERGENNGETDRL
ncbi:MAG: hypothetical protein HDR04_09050 [Lachnospiraceae bacterium]|nr:hypothetical protein [Lachnospiraceae bacterium]